MKQQTKKVIAREIIIFAVILLAAFIYSQTSGADKYGEQEVINAFWTSLFVFTVIRIVIWAVMVLFIKDKKNQTEQKE